jgi:hypothetical protein
MCWWPTKAQSIAERMGGRREREERGEEGVGGEAGGFETEEGGQR